MLAIQYEFILISSVDDLFRTQKGKNKNKNSKSVVYYLVLSQSGQLRFTKVSLRN